MLNPDEISGSPVKKSWLWIHSGHEKLRDTVVEEERQEEP